MWFSYRWLEPNFVTQMCGERERERERERMMCCVNCEQKDIRDLTVPSLLPQWWVPLRAFHMSNITTKTIWKLVEATPMLTQTKMKMSHPLIPTLRLRMHLFWIWYPSMWNSIDMRNLGVRHSTDYNLEKMCIHAINCSCGHLQDIKIDHFSTNELLAYITQRYLSIFHYQLLFDC